MGCGDGGSDIIRTGGVKAGGGRGDWGGVLHGHILVVPVLGIKGDDGHCPGKMIPA